MSAIDRNELDGYEALVSELRATAPVAPERLRERVLEGAPSPRRRSSRKRRLFLVVVPVAVVLAVGAAVVHGVVSSGAHSAGAPALYQNQTAGVPPQTVHSSSRELAPIRKCVQSENNALPAPASATSAEGLAKKGRLDLAGATSAVTIPKNRLVHATASLEVQVTDRSDLSQQTNKASQIVGSLGGYAQSVRYQSSHQGYGNALLALRVPVQKAQVAIAKLGNLGTLLSQQVSTKDLQQQLTHQTNGIGSLRRSIAVYEQALQSGSLPASQRVEIQIKLENARHALTQLRRARTGTLASAATADISLVLTTRNHAVVVTHHPRGRFGRLLGSAAGFLALEGIIVLYALVVLSPLVLLGGLGWWILRERRRREERLLASA
jgi:hypothetical protein